MGKNIFIALLCTLFLVACGKSQKDKLTIAAAANMQFAMKELVHSFSEKTGIECETIITSSGKLTAQIKEGAPFDVFVSANMKYPNDLFQSGFTWDEPQIYAFGKVVLWTMKNDVDPSIDFLSNEKVKHIAIANAKTAPYGKAAIELLEHLNIFKKLEKKLVFGESISQVNQFITSQAADLGFTSKSIVLSPKIKGKGKWMEMEAEHYSPIAQGIVLLKNDETKLDDAQKFRNFLFSNEGIKILEAFGYSTPN